MKLVLNMRVANSNNPNAAQFSSDLLKIGDGIVPSDENGEIDISSVAQYVSSEEILIEKIYPNLLDNFRNPDYFSCRSILAPLNIDIDRINTKIMERIQEIWVELTSMDSTIDEDDAINYPVETLNRFQPSGFHSTINLKLGCPIMLIRNLDNELVNGTRLILINIAHETY